MSRPPPPTPKPAIPPKSPAVPAKPPVIPQKPPAIPQKPGDNGPPEAPRKPKRVMSSGNIGKISKGLNIPTKASTAESARDDGPPVAPLPLPPSSSASRPSKKSKGKFSKKSLFSTFRKSQEKNNDASASPPSTSGLQAPSREIASSPAITRGNSEMSINSSPLAPPKKRPSLPDPTASSPLTPKKSAFTPPVQPMKPPATPPTRTLSPKNDSPRTTSAPVSAVQPEPPTRNRRADAPPRPANLPEKVSLENLSEKDQKRYKIVSEILSTEETYVGVLETMLNGYQRPLYAKAETDEMPGISKSQILAIFSNTEQLLPMNQHLLSEIRLRVDTWHATQKVGDIFEKTGPFFKIYNMYGNNYDKGQEVLDKCRLDGSFNAQIEIIASKVNSLKLDNLLIQPIQRIPRYNLLLRDLLAKTDENHPDYGHLTVALEVLEGVMSYLDKNITEVENIEKMLNFSSVKGAGALVQAHRRLVQEFSLNIREKDTSQVGKFSKKFKAKGLFKESKINVWLFNDVLVHLLSSKSKKKTNVASTKYTWPLELVWIKDIPEIEPTDTKLPYSFLLVGPRTTYTLRFPDPTDKTKWMKVFEEAINSCLTEENAPDAKQLCRYGTYEFPDKDRGTYQGWWKFGKIHGQGIYTFHSNKFTGHFEYNQKSGMGTMELSSGEIYNGEWKEDLPHGTGTVEYPNGDRYEGDWVEGYRSGKGTHYYANGDKFSGDWSNNVPHGEGHFTTVEKQEYQGGWKYGVYHGSGILGLQNGKRYEGEFKEGHRHGEGRMDYGNGEFYVGQWAHDRRHGKGVHYSEIEGVYNGDFREDFKEGHGTMQYSSGDSYTGQWKRNLYNGTGTLTCASGGMLSYEGQWENNLKHGKGVMVYRNEGKYEGHFREDLPHGHGVFVSRNAVSSDGKWEEGRKQGKLALSVGQSKFSAQCQNALMDEGKIHSFYVFPEPPVVNLCL